METPEQKERAELSAKHKELFGTNSAPNIGLDNLRTKINSRIAEIKASTAGTTGPGPDTKTIAPEPKPEATTIEEVGTKFGVDITSLVNLASLTEEGSQFVLTQGETKLVNDQYDKLFPTPPLKSESGSNPGNSDGNPQGEGDLNEPITQAHLDQFPALFNAGVLIGETKAQAIEKVKAFEKNQFDNAGAANTGGNSGAITGKEGGITQADIDGDIKLQRAGVQVGATIAEAYEAIELFEKNQAENLKDAVHKKNVLKYGEGYIKATHHTRGNTIFSSIAWQELGKDKLGWKQVVETPEEVKALQK